MRGREPLIYLTDVAESNLYDAVTFEHDSAQWMMNMYAKHADFPQVRTQYHIRQRCSARLGLGGRPGVGSFRTRLNGP